MLQVQNSQNETSGTTPKGLMVAFKLLSVLSFPAATRKKSAPEPDELEFRERLKSTIIRLDSGIIPDSQHNLKGIREICKSYIFDPFELPYFTWTCVIGVSVLYNLFSVIARIAFNDMDEFWQEAWITFDLLVDVVYVADMFVETRKAFHQQGVLVRDKRKLAQKYIRSGQFKLDLLGTIPFDYVYMVTHGLKLRNWFRLNRLLRFSKAVELSDRALHICSSYPTLVRLLSQMMVLLIIMHWNACWYYQTSKWIGFGTDTWVFNATKYPQVVDRYIISFYWVAMQLTTIAEVPRATCMIEYVLVTGNTLFAIMYVASTIGGIASIASNLSNKSYEFHSTVVHVQEYMRRNNIGMNLRDRINIWYQHNGSNSNNAERDSEVLSMLPEKLQTEINMDINLVVLSKVKVFRDTDPGFLVKLVNKLKLQLYNPEEFICQKGDVGKEMFIVKTGQLVCIDSAGNHLRELLAGEVFGELSLLEIPGMLTGNRRTASVKSAGYTNLYCLSKEDLREVLNDFPRTKQIFIENGRQILLKDGLLKNVRASEPDVADIKDSEKWRALRVKEEMMSQKLDVATAYVKYFYEDINLTLTGLENDIDQAILELEEKKLNMNK